MICVLLVAGTASWTLATEWVEYFATKPYFYYYDREDMRPLEYYVNLLGLKISKPGLYRVWLKRLVKDPSGRKMHVDIQEARKLTTQGYDFYSHTIYQKDVKCSERKVRLLSEADYDSEGRLLAGPHLTIAMRDGQMSSRILTTLHSWSRSADRKRLRS